MDPILNDVAVPTSKIRVTAIFFLLIAGNKKVRG
jgi:hypothetical protein